MSKFLRIPPEDKPKIIIQTSHFEIMAADSQERPTDGLLKLHLSVYKAEKLVGTDMARVPGDKTDRFAEKLMVKAASAATWERLQDAIAEAAREVREEAKAAGLETRGDLGLK